jgi:O-antigen/teichoic acid export membrane protein
MNLIAQAVPLIVGVISIPFIVRYLGPERFGLLSLSWIILGYFTIFDLGLGRATTKYVAEAIGTGDPDQTTDIVWTSVTFQVIFGIVGSIIVVIMTPLLTERILRISPALIGEARTTFYVLAFSVPVVLISSSFSGVLEACQRFDMLSRVRIIAGIATFLVPLIAGFMHLDLPFIIALLVLVKALALVTFFIIAAHIFPTLKWPHLMKKHLITRLFVFGSWITVSNLVSPFLRYLDRFMIGAIISTTAVAYYSAPFDIMERLWIIPTSLVLTLFPAFSAFSGLGHHERSRILFMRSIKYLMVILVPFICILIVFAEPILLKWLGANFAQNSTFAFQILAIGALVGILAPIPGTIIQGYGRPDIIAKLYLLYIPLNFVLVWILVRSMGLAGAALSCMLRTILDTVLLLIIALRIIHLPLTTLFNNLSRAIATAAIAGILLWIIMKTSNTFVLQAILSGCSVTAIAILSWHWVLTTEDKSLVRSLIERRLKHRA